MLPQNLPNVHRTVNDGVQLRYSSADAISYIEMAAARGASGKVSAAALRDFFIACAQACQVATADATMHVALVAV